MSKGRKFYPNDMADRFRSALRRVLPTNAGRVLSALSGGADSTALLYLMAQAAPEFEFDVAAAHLDHGLRGDEGAKDLEFARQTAKSLGVPFYSHKTDCRELARKKGLSLEEAAREARYSFLERIRRDIGADAVAVGHTADDNAELVLMNLIRGSGTQGLAGMLAERNRIIRPLLSFWRDEIVGYLNDAGLSWVEDSTNRDTAFTRNRVRLELVPFLEKFFNPAVKQALNRTAGLLRDEESVWDRLVEKAQTEVNWKADGDRVSLDASGLKGIEPALARRLIREAARVAQGSARGLGLDHVEAVLAFSGSDSGRIDLPGDLEAFLDSGNLVIGRPRVDFSAKSFEYSLPIPGRVEIAETGIVVSARIIDSSAAPSHEKLPPETALLDLGAVTPPLVIRSRKPGDRFQPLGMNGTKTISDFFTDLKITAEKRDQTPLVEDAHGILWVCGYRPAEWAKTGAKTAKYLLLSLEMPPKRQTRSFLDQQ